MRGQGMDLGPRGGKTFELIREEQLENESHFSVPCQAPPKSNLCRGKLSFPCIFSRAENRKKIETRLYWFPLAAANYHQISGLKKYKYIPLQSRGQEEVFNGSLGLHII